MEWPHLNHAPVVEGLIDLQVEGVSEMALKSLTDCADSLAADFPSREELRTFMGQIGFSTGGDPSITAQGPAPAGVVLRSADGKWVVQFRLDGFTLSRLEPYTSWDELTSRARTLWSSYSRAAKPDRIVRVASRFINRIPLPPDQPFEKTFATTFTLAAKLPQTVVGYLLRVVVPFEREGVMAIITQALPQNTKDCTFDLDVFAMNPDGMSEAELWSKLDQLRDVKNRLFFESLTAEALDKFK